MTKAQLSPIPGSPGPAATGEGLETFLTYRLHLLNKLTDKVTDGRYAALGISLPMARCIAALGHFGSLSVNTLAARANLDKSQASRMADALVQRDYVLKIASEHDQRGVELKLSRSGTAMFKKVIQIANDRNREVFDCLTESERQAFGKILARLLTHARQPGDSP